MQRYKIITNTTKGMNTETAFGHKRSLIKYVNGIAVTNKDVMDIMIIDSNSNVVYETSPARQRAERER